MSRGGKGERTAFSPSRPPRLPPSRFPGVQLNSLPTYRRALLSERLEQAILISNEKGYIRFLSSKKIKTVW